jgi:hypothetical protein
VVGPVAEGLGVIWAEWVIAVSGLLTAIVSVAGQVQHRRQDNERFARVHRMIGEPPEDEGS